MDCIVMDEEDTRNFIEILSEYMRISLMHQDERDQDERDEDIYSKAEKLLDKYLTEEIALKYVNDYFMFKNLPERYQTKEFVSKTKMILAELRDSNFGRDKVLISKLIDNGATDLDMINMSLFLEDPEYLQEIIDIGLSDPKYQFYALIRRTNLGSSHKYLIDLFTTNPKLVLKIHDICSYEMLQSVDFVKEMLEKFPEHKKLITDTASLRVATILRAEKEELDRKNKYRMLFDNL